MEWLAKILALLVVAVLIVRRGNWNGPVMFWQHRYASDLTLRTRMTEDAVRDANDQHDDRDVAP